MKNFIFKSNKEHIDLLKIFTQLDLLLAEQRQQRHDLSKIIKLLKGLIGEFIKPPDEEIEEHPDDTGDSI